MSRAPQFILSGNSQSGDIEVNQVDAVIVPATACGGSGLLQFAQTPAQIIAVQANHTRLQVSSESLGIEAVSVPSYLEAIGWLVAQRAGLNPSALSTNLGTLRPLN
ncbi:DUF3326 domain-containing protein [Neosynechococcus sphagnicola]|uniref:DUF3326 domain-containing protein n=1 Tax=Neosynechococcus sphagnicola TaxID=1501145 RepID=UPI003084207F